ncbi:hypothetical protein KC909_05830, partial [Candidatus Dojkabacteria bacterium]|nr:hypothetical protein [Candidatus Dojkabacteria bacterium]
VVIAILFSFIAVAAFSDLQEIKEVVLLILATPFAMLTVVYAEKYKMDSVFAAQLVTFSLFIQILILPVIIWIGRNFI